MNRYQVATAKPASPRELAGFTDVVLVGYQVVLGLLGDRCETDCTVNGVLPANPKGAMFGVAFDFDCYRAVVITALLRAFRRVL